MCGVPCMALLLSCQGVILSAWIQIGLLKRFPVQFEGNYYRMKLDYEASSFHSPEICIIYMTFSRESCLINPQSIDLFIISNPKPRACYTKKFMHQDSLSNHHWSINQEVNYQHIYKELSYLPIYFSRNTSPVIERNISWHIFFFKFLSQAKFPENSFLALIIE